MESWSDKKHEDWYKIQHKEEMEEIEQREKKAEFLKSFQKIEFDKSAGVCSLLEAHHTALSEDPERLSTNFLKNLINRKEDPCPQVSD
jgi:hypothetical protein